MKTQRTRAWTDKLPVSILKLIINRWRPFWGAAIKVKTISSDYRFVEVRMKLHWYNKNLIGTHFGGSIYAMTDPFYMLILLKNLGNDYIVWDKASFIDFKKPGRGELKATFSFSPEEIEDVRLQTSLLGKYIFDRTVDVTDEEGDIVATVVKTLYVRQKLPVKNRSTK